MIGSRLSCGAIAAKAFAASSRDDERTFDHLGEILRIDQRLVQRLEAVADGLNLPLVAGKVEQGGCVPPC